MTTTEFRYRPAPGAAHRAPPASQPSGVSGLWGPATVDLTVVIPFFNAGTALRATVLAVIDRLTRAAVSFEVIAVCDGSTDGSARTITDIAHTRVLTNPRNEGKGAALRRGFAAAGGAWVGFIDADGDLSPELLVDYLRQAREERPAGVYADKRHTCSGSAATGLRKALSLGYSLLVSGLFDLGIRDTQTGCKIFRRDVLAELLPRLCESRFAIDLELFVAARTAGITDFVPAPVDLRRRVNGSTVTGRAILRTIGDTFAVYGRHHLRTPHRRAAAPGPQVARFDIAMALAC